MPNITSNLKSKKVLIIGGICIVLVLGLISQCGGGGGDGNENAGGPNGNSNSNNQTTTSIEIDFNQTTTTAPPFGSIDCGIITFSGVEQRLVVVRGTTCDQGKVIISTYDQSAELPDDWSCYIGKEGDSESVVCGAGSSGSEVREKTKVVILRDPAAPVAG